MCCSQNWQNVLLSASITSGVHLVSVYTVVLQAGGNCFASLYRVFEVWIILSNNELTANFMC